MKCDHYEVLEPDECEECREYIKQEALSAGIPLAVFEGKAKLSDYFSQDYIDWKCGKVREDDPED